MSKCTVEDSGAKVLFFLNIRNNFYFFFGTINKQRPKDPPYSIHWKRWPSSEAHFCIAATAFCRVSWALLTL